MAYLLDTNTLIQAKNEYYAFDVCPGFWDWVRATHAAGNLASIDRVRHELVAGHDELADWARGQPDTFFLAGDAASAAAMRRVSAWVENGDFQDRAKRSFLSCADPFLVAYALGHGHTVVSHEIHVEGQRNKVKIPTVCLGLAVPCVRTFQVLRDSGAAFVLRDPGRAADVVPTEDQTRAPLQLAFDTNSPGPGAQPQQPTV